MGEGSATAMTRALATGFAVAILLWVGAAWSADVLSESVAAIERASTEPDGTRVVVGHISRKLGVSVETLRQERAQTGLGWGDLLLAHRLAKLTGGTVDQITAGRYFRSRRRPAKTAPGHQLAHRSGMAVHRTYFPRRARCRAASTVKARVTGTSGGISASWSFVK